MRPLLVTGLLTVAALAAPIAQSTARRDIDNVAAFARLYGVVRYFYPSDAAAALDWNRFAVHGVARVRGAQDAKALETALKSLFGPLGPGITLGSTLPPHVGPEKPAGRLVAWRYVGPGFAAAGGFRTYRAKRTNRPEFTNPSIDGFVTVMQSIPAEALRGKTVRLRGHARVTCQTRAGLVRCGCAWIGQTARWASSTTWGIVRYARRTGVSTRSTDQSRKTQRTWLLE
jgi:hypothetical protein